MPRPTIPVRYSIVLLALLIDLMSYVDRTSIALAAPRMAEEFGLSSSQLGLVFSAFSLAYFLGQTPMGALADRWGARWLVVAAILWWSLFTGLTAVAVGFVSLLAIRFLFGVGESALSPAIAVSFTRWIPLNERSTAFGAFLSGGRLGAAAAPVAAAAIMSRFGWRAIFVSFALIGVVWVALWLFWYRDDPSRHPAMRPPELERIQKGIGGAPQGESPRLVLTRPLVMLLAVAFGYTFLWQFYITWFPTYLMKARGFSLQEAAPFAGLPFLFGMVANWVGGFISDALAHRYTPEIGRRVLGFAAFSGCGLLVLAGLAAPSPSAGALLMALAAGVGDLALGSCWSAATAIGGRAAGAAAGLMNAASNAAGFASPAILGWLLDQGAGWNAVLLAGVATDFAAAFLWLGVNRSPDRQPVTAD